MRGTAHEVVVIHHECAVTQQMRQDRLDWNVKNADIEEKKCIGKELNVMLKEKST